MGRYAFAVVGLLFISAAVVSLALWTGLIPATAALPSAAYVVVAGGVQLTYFFFPALLVLSGAYYLGRAWRGERPGRLVVGAATVQSAALAVFSYGVWQAAYDCSRGSGKDGLCFLGGFFIGLAAAVGFGVGSLVLLTAVLVRRRAEARALGATQGGS